MSSKKTRLPDEYERLPNQQVSLQRFQDIQQMTGNAEDETVCSVFKIGDWNRLDRVRRRKSKNP